MIKSMRSWNDLEAGVEGDDAVEAVVLDGDADARVRVLAEPVVHGEESARPHSHRGLQGQHKGHGRNHVKTAPSVRRKCAHKKCGAVRDGERAQARARAECTAMGAVCLRRRHGVVLGWAHDLMLRYIDERGVEVIGVIRSEALGLMRQSCEAFIPQGCTILSSH